MRLGLLILAVPLQLASQAAPPALEFEVPPSNRTVPTPRLYFGYGVVV
jgi:hypothetical protein